jgi:hypothetical protein
MPARRCKAATKAATPHTDWMEAARSYEREAATLLTHSGCRHMPLRPHSVPTPSHSIATPSACQVAMLDANAGLPLSAIVASLGALSNQTDSPDVRLVRVRAGAGLGVRVIPTRPTHPTCAAPFVAALTPTPTLTLALKSGPNPKPNPNPDPNPDPNPYPNSNPLPGAPRLCRGPGRGAAGAPTHRR